uniref:Uncharacterized protein n=1 Tax=Rangifer tarandus platyrhynchus TaxID=3082113 RepID=A0ACB0DTU0_RANTA|nr:unnamed protein product [Rangifer tarandus platyrhynchus]
MPRSVGWDLPFPPLASQPHSLQHLTLRRLHNCERRLRVEGERRALRAEVVTRPAAWTPLFGCPRPEGGAAPRSQPAARPEAAGWVGRKPIATFYSPFSTVFCPSSGSPGNLFDNESNFSISNLMLNLCKWKTQMAESMENANGRCLTQKLLCAQKASSGI